MTMHEFIKNRRLAKKLTQAQLADYLGYTSSMPISLIESGKMKVPVKSVRKLCKVLGISEQKFIQFIINEFEENLIKEIES